MLYRICAAMALAFITTAAHADPTDLLQGYLYAADALSDRQTGHRVDVQVVDLPDNAPQEAREDLVNVLPAWRIEPGEAVERPEARGAIARVALYMSDRYGLPMPAEDHQRYVGWTEQYPVQAWEQARNRATACVQGRGNPLVGLVDPRAIDNCRSEQATSSGDL